MNKILAIIVALIVGTITVNAQSDCEINYAIYRNDYKQGNYKEALVAWRKIFNECPEHNEYTFANGPRLYHERIKNDKENQLIYLDTLMMIYDDRIEYFGRREYVLGKKGVDLLKYNPSRFTEAYEMLKVSVDALGNSTNPTVIVSYFKSLDNVQRSTEEVTKQDVLDTYIVVSDIISHNIINNEKYARYYELAQIRLNNLLIPYDTNGDYIVEEELENELELEDAETDQDQIMDMEEGDIDEPFIMVEQMPLFGDCEDEICTQTEIMKFIARNFKYPEISKANGVEGRIILEFVVEKDGTVGRVKILRGLDKNIDKAAVNVLESLPIFKPGRQIGKPVPVKYTVPIKCTLGNGCISGDCVNGYGTFIWASGDKYVGEWKDGKPDGKGKKTYKNGKIEEGRFMIGVWIGEETIEID